MSDVPPTRRDEPLLAATLADLEEIAASRARLRSRLFGRERLVTVALAAAFVIAAAACAVLMPSSRTVSPAVIALLVAAYALVSKVEFEVGPGSAVPTELVLVPMLLVLPPGIVPLAVATGLLAAGAADRLRGRMRGERVAVLFCSSWHSVGPALVVGMAASDAPAWGDAPVYAAALAAQFLFDDLAILVRHRLGRGVPVRRLGAPLALVAVVDCALAPVAFAVGLATLEAPVAILCVLPLAGLLGALEAERRRRIDESLVLGEAVEDASRTARLDPLTGVGNRLAWEERLALAEEAGAAATVVLVDLDQLKDTNDTYGHDAGDRLIQALAAGLQRTLPDAELVARVGGDEFAVLLGGSADAHVVSRLRRGLDGLQSATGIPVRASVGVAGCPPCPSLTDALRVADSRLYAAKPSARRVTGT
jgi:diguanylate cyclase (GGDEF)-like protein